MKLFWVFGEYFVRPEVWHDVFEPFGVKCRPVLQYKKETELKTVVQLDITELATSSLRSNDLLTTELCPVCGLGKYDYSGHGPYPTFEVPQSQDMFKTQECFGGGWEVFRLIIISQDLYRHILKKKQTRGVSFIPMVDDPQEYIRTHLE
jgi:hypothetical protein